MKLPKFSLRTLLAGSLIFTMSHGCYYSTKQKQDPETGTLYFEHKNIWHDTYRFSFHQYHLETSAFPLAVRIDYFPSWFFAPLKKPFSWSHSMNITNCDSKECSQKDHSLVKRAIERWDAGFTE